MISKKETADLPNKKFEKYTLLTTRSSLEQPISNEVDRENF